MGIEPLRVALVGAGRWGARLHRALSRSRNASLKAICDVEIGRAERLAAGAARCLSSMGQVLEDPTISALVIATPPDTHAALAEQALLASRHVFVEKPMALSTADAVALRNTSLRVGRQLMVGHILEFHPAVLEAERLARAGVLGRIRAVFCMRHGRASDAQDSLWWSLAPHDVTLIHRLLGARATGLRAWATNGGGSEIGAVLEAPGGCRGVIHLRGQSDTKTRRTVVVGSKALALFDDQCRPPQQLRIRRLNGAGAPRALELDLGRSGPAAFRALAEWSTALADTEQYPWQNVETADAEPLLVEVQHFVDCCSTGTPTRTDAQHGLEVVRILEAGDLSMSTGAPVRVGQDRAVEAATPGPARTGSI